MWDVHAIQLIITNACNFKCEYCYECYEDKRMDWKTAKQTIDFLANTPGNHSINVNFFGGEPLLYWELIEDLVCYGEKKDRKFTFGITTNTSLINRDILRFMRRHNMSLLNSIDGVKEAQKYRVPKKGDFDKVFDDIIKNSKMALEMGLGHTGRMTVIPETIEYMFDSIVFLNEEVGFPMVFAVPAVSGHDTTFTENDWKRVQEEIDKLTQWFIDKIKKGKRIQFNYCDSLIEYKMGLKSYKPHFSCGIGKGFFGVGVDGNIYPCQRLVGTDEIKMGDVFSGMNKKGYELNELFNNTIPKRDFSECIGCENTMCEGACVAVSYERYGSFSTPCSDECRYQKMLYRGVLEVYETLKNTDYLNKVYRVNKGNKKPRKTWNFNQPNWENNQNNQNNQNKRNNKSDCSNDFLKNLKIDDLNNNERIVIQKNPDGKPLVIKIPKDMDLSGDIDLRKSPKGKPTLIVEEKK
ncbi:MAG: radical SAM protein [archaeon]